jgi:hypothetical protein
MANVDGKRSSAPFRISTVRSALAGPDLEAQRPIWSVLGPLGTARRLYLSGGSPRMARDG